MVAMVTRCHGCHGNTPPFCRMNMVALTDYSNQFVESVCGHQAGSVYHWEPLPTVIMDCYVRFLPDIQVIHHSISLYVISQGSINFISSLPLRSDTLRSSIKCGCYPFVHIL